MYYRYGYNNYRRHYPCNCPIFYPWSYYPRCYRYGAFAAGIGLGILFALF